MVMYILGTFSIRLGVSIMIAIVLLGIIFRFRAKKSDADSLEIMKERLEKGEITRKEYDQARKRQGK